MASVLEEERPEDYLTRLALSDLGRSYKSLVLQELLIPPGSVVLDLGCGPGADLSAFAEAVGPTGRVLGVDHDVAAVAQAADLMGDDVRVEVSQGDIHHLDLATESVDRVHTDRVLQHVADPGLRRRGGLPSPSARRSGSIRRA